MYKIVSPTSVLFLDFLTISCLRVFSVCIRISSWMLLVGEEGLFTLTQIPLLSPPFTQSRLLRYFSWMKEEGMFTSSWTPKFLSIPFHPRAGFGLVRAPYKSQLQLQIQHLAPAWGRRYTFRRIERQRVREVPARAEEEQAIVWDFARPDSKQILHWRRQYPCAAVNFIHVSYERLC